MPGHRHASEIAAAGNPPVGSPGATNYTGDGLDMNRNAAGAWLGISGMLALIAACGGGGGSDSGSPSPSPPPPPPPSTTGWTLPPAPPTLPAPGSTATGVFRDSNVEGLSYSSAGLSGTTGANGRYQYVVGQPITFSIGAVTLGTAPGQLFMHPMYLPTDLGSNLTNQIDNRLRFLQMLDSDGNPENGIQISQAVRDRAQNWSQVDFTTAPADLATALATIRADAQSADGTPHDLPDVTPARAHFGRSVWCTYSGVYRGNYSGGGENGYVALVSFGPSLIHAVAYDRSDRTLSLFEGSTPSALSLTPDFQATEIGGAAQFSGDYDNPLIITGTWSAGGASGAFLASRSYSSDLPVYRIAGSTFPTLLLVNLEIDANNQVTGIVVDLDVAGNGQPVQVSGTLVGSSLSVTTADNSFSITNGTFDTSAAPGTQVLTGTLRDNRHARDVSLSVPGCRLN